MGGDNMGDMVFNEAIAARIVKASVERRRRVIHAIVKGLLWTEVVPAIGYTDRVEKFVDDVIKAAFSEII